MGRSKESFPRFPIPISIEHKWWCQWKVASYIYSEPQEILETADIQAHLDSFQSTYSRVSWFQCCHLRVHMYICQVYRRDIYSIATRHYLGIQPWKWLIDRYMSTGRSVDAQHTCNWVDFSVGYTYCSVEGLVIVPAHFQMFQGCIDIIAMTMHVLGYCTLGTESDLGFQTQESSHQRFNGCSPIDSQRSTRESFPIAATPLHRRINKHKSHMHGRRLQHEIRSASLRQKVVRG